LDCDSRTCSRTSPCDDAAMGIDSHWRTRTIGEAQEQGYTHLGATCPGCNRIADVPWPLEGHDPDDAPREHPPAVPAVRERGADYWRAAPRHVSDRAAWLGERDCRRALRQFLSEPESS